MDKYSQNDNANFQKSTPITVRQVDESIFGILFLLIIIPKIYLNWKNISGLPLPKLTYELVGLLGESIGAWLAIAGLYYVIVRIKNKKNSEKIKNTRIVIGIILSLSMILGILQKNEIKDGSNKSLDQASNDSISLEELLIENPPKKTIAQEEIVNNQSMILDLFGAKYKEKMSQVYIFVDKYMVVGTRKEKDKILGEMGNMLNKEITDLDVVLLYTLSEVYKKNEYGVDWKGDFGEEEFIKLLKAFGSLAYSKLETEENIVNRYNFMLIRLGVFGSLHLNYNKVSIDDVRNIYKEYFNSVSQTELKTELEKFQLSWEKMFNIHHEVDNGNKETKNITKKPLQDYLDKGFLAYSLYELAGISEMDGAKNGLNIIEEGLIDYPNSSELISMKADIYNFKYKKLTEALALYNTSIKLDPTNIEPYIGKIGILINQKRLNEAKETFKIANNIDSKNTNLNIYRQIFNDL